MEPQPRALAPTPQLSTLGNQPCSTLPAPPVDVGWGCGSPGVQFLFSLSTSPAAWHHDFVLVIGLMTKKASEGSPCWGCLPSAGEWLLQYLPAGGAAASPLHGGGSQFCRIRGFRKSGFASTSTQIFPPRISRSHSLLIRALTWAEQTYLGWKFNPLKALLLLWLNPGRMFRLVCPLATGGGDSFICCQEGLWLS